MTVAVTVGTPAELTAAPHTLSFGEANFNVAQTVTVAAAQDADAEADPPVQMKHRASGGGYDGAAAVVQVTIVEDDTTTVALEDGRAVEGAGSVEFAVTLSLSSDRPVTVEYATGGGGDTATGDEDYTRGAGTLTFAAGSTAAQTIEVAVYDDLLDEADEVFRMTLSNANTPLAGGEETATATGTIEDDDPLPGLSIEDGSLTEGADDGLLRLAVRLAPASGRTVTVSYATEDGTAKGGLDYTSVSGVLTFAARSTERTIAVPVADDALDEDDNERFVLVMDAAVDAVFAADRDTATGIIADDDPEPRLQIEDARLGEGEDGGIMRFAVSLDPASGREVTVQYATADGDAGSADYTPASGTLTFAPGTTTNSIGVSVTSDDAVEAPETFSINLAAPVHASLADDAATGTITDPPLELASLQVSGAASSLKPAFSSDIHHYAVTCRPNTMLGITAVAKRTYAVVTVQHRNPEDSRQSAGAVTDQIRAGEYSDTPIVLSDGAETTRYVIHCVSRAFPDIKVISQTDDVTEGLLFMKVSGYLAVVDNNGVPRYYSQAHGRLFQRHLNGPLIDGKRVRYSFLDRGAALLEADFGWIKRVGAISPLVSTDSHDFQITEDGTLLFMSYFRNTRDYSMYKDNHGTPYSTMEEVRDSVIQEVSVDGKELFRWNSWDHVKLDPDCRRGTFTGDYAHLNSIYEVEGGDLILSLRGCSQVVRIDRSSGTGALVWKLGGTTPTRTAATQFLKIVDDPAGEICGQHQVTVTSRGTLLMFDNGSNCQGPRRAEERFSRIVEYDISSGTQARMTREYRRPGGYFTRIAGGVVELDNGHWLIAWGGWPNTEVEDAVSISEVDPDTGTVHLEMLILDAGSYVNSYRVYRYPEDEVDIPLTLPY